MRILLLLAVLMAFPAAARAQPAPGGDTTAIALLLLPQLRSTLPSGPAALDPEPFCETRLVGWRCSGPVRAMAQRLGLALNSREFTLICLGGGCRLLNVLSLVEIETLAIEERAGRASVAVSVWKREGQRGSAIVQQRQRYAFTRVRGTWQLDR